MTATMPLSTVTAVTDSDARVWRINLDQPGDGLWWPLLSDHERERAGLLACPQARRRYTVAHAALRAVLGRLCGVAADRLEFRTEALGRPYLLRPPDGPDPPDFNLSHSGEWALVGVAPPPLRIGVDVEQVRPDLDYLAMARHLYQPDEVDRLTAAGPVLGRTEYFLLWSAKEAYAKAIGVGLPGLRDVMVRRHGNSPYGIVQSRHEPVGWPVRWLEVAPGYTAAVVTGVP